MQALKNGATYKERRPESKLKESFHSAVCVSLVIEDLAFKQLCLMTNSSYYSNISQAITYSFNWDCVIHCHIPPICLNRLLDAYNMQWNLLKQLLEKENWLISCSLRCFNVIPEIKCRETTSQISLWSSYMTLK